MIYFSLAILAGFFAAMASLCAKLALSPDEMFKLEVLQHLWRGFHTYSSQIIYVSRGILFLLIFLFNGFMWTFFVKSMRKSTSSAQALVTNSGSNFIFSALFGKIIFGEVLSLQWWCGASLIILGLYLINRSSNGIEADQTVTKKKS